MEVWIIFVIVLVLLILLIVWEYKTHDCIAPGRCGEEYLPLPPNSSPKEQVLRLYEMTGKAYDYSVWRQSLIVGLLAAARSLNASVIAVGGLVFGPVAT